MNNAVNNIIPAAPGFAVLAYDADLDEINSYPVIAWEIGPLVRDKRYATKAVPLTLVRPYPQCNHGLLQPDGWVLDLQDGELFLIEEWLMAEQADAQLCREAEENAEAAA